MSVLRWQGDAVGVKQVTTVLVSAFDAATTYTLTVNGKDVSILGSAANAASAIGVATSLVSLWNASTEPEFAEVTASNVSGTSDTITLTGDTYGKPFTVTSAESGGTGTVDNPSTGTAATGPNHWSNADNWSGGAVPVNSDDVIIEGGSDILYGLDQNAVTLTSLTIKKSFTGKIGLPEFTTGNTVSTSGISSQYAEYRDTYLKIGATTITIGDGDGTGSQRIKINTGTVQYAANVYGTGGVIETGVPSLLLKGSHASNVLNVLRGSVGLAMFAGETAQLATLRVGYVDNVASDAVVYCGSGVTLATINQTGGVLTVNSATTSLTVDEGATCHVIGAGAQTAITARGTLYYRGTGTVTSLTVGGTGTADFSRDPKARTVTSGFLYRGGKWLDPSATVTVTNGIDVLEADLHEVTLRLGRSRNLVISAA